MQPAYDPRSARSSGESLSSATTSLIPSRPPGSRTRAISVSTVALSVERLITQLEITTSTEAAGSGIASISPLRKWTFRTPDSRDVPLSEREHLVRHVEPVGRPGRADPLRGQDHVDAPTRPEIEHGLALAQLGDRRGVPATQRGEDGGVGELVALLRLVERFSERDASDWPSAQHEPLPQLPVAPSVTARADSA